MHYHARVHSPPRDLLLHHAEAKENNLKVSYRIFGAVQVPDHDEMRHNGRSATPASNFTRPRHQIPPGEGMFIVGVSWLLTKTVPPARWGLGRYRQDARVADFSLPLSLRTLIALWFRSRVS
jgi:hypothetical protein